MRAMLAPSVHNTQPWHFTTVASGLEVSLDRTRQLAVLDPTGRQLHLSVGCALFNARVSLAASGFFATVVLNPEGVQPDTVARIDISDWEGPDLELATLDSAVDSRQTNRRQFTSESVPPKLISTLIEAARSEGAQLHPLTSAADKLALARLNNAADTQQITDPAYRAELRAWTTNEPGRRDGVPARVVPHVDSTTGDELPMRDFDTQGSGWLPADTGSTIEQCLLILGTAGDDPRSWLAGGQALERIWLEITRAGFATSLFTQVIEVPTLRSELRSELQLESHPHVVLRIGRAPLTASTSRRAIADVLTDLTEE